MRAPDVKTAVDFYDMYPELGTKEIRELFDVSSSTAGILKRKAKQQMVEDDTYTFLPSNVETSSAYKAWGIDINNYRKRYERLKKNGVIKSNEPESEEEQA
ncbi:MAG: hypothetical protein LUH08_03810 [Ruminococcus sp.]|nr:hypothetical protein [Ruminococcus sp.]